MSFIHELRNLDRRDIATWSVSIRLFFVVLLIGAALLGGWYFKINGQQSTLERATQHERTLKQEFVRKQKRAAQAPALKAQLVQMNAMLDKLLQRLPGKTEIPQLLINVSQTAQVAGIVTEEFQPQPEIKKKIYAEAPVKLKMIGTYHQFGTFISQVASLPVILSVHDVSLKQVKDDKGEATGKLALNGVITTYRYLGKTVKKDGK